MNRSSRSILFVLSCAAAFPAVARDADPRVRTVAWRQDDIVTLNAMPGRTLAVMLAPGERISGIAVHQPGTFRVEPAMDGDGFLVTPLVVGARSALTVTSDLRSYRFDLIANDDRSFAPFIIKLAFARSPPNTSAPAGVASSGWRITGSKELRPIAMRDDGSKTYIQWSEDQALPAVFALNPRGQEEVVDGYMRGQLFVIDRVHPRLVFRIDRQRAVAVKQAHR